MGSEFSKGLAVTFQDKPSCKKCALELAATLPEAQKSELLTRLAGTPKPAEVPITRKSARATVSTQRVVKPASSSRLPIVLAVVGVVALALVLAAFMGTKSKARIARPPEPAQSDAPPVAQNRNVPNDSVKEPLENARAYKGDLAGQISEYKKAVVLLKDSPFLEEARKELRALLDREFEVIAGKADELSRAQEFGKAIDLLYRERRRHEEFEWMEWVDKKSDDVAGVVENLFAEVKGKAVDAKKANDEKSVQEFKTQVAKWGIERFVFDFDRAMAEAFATKAQPQPQPQPQPHPNQPPAAPKEFVFGPASFKSGGLFARSDDAKLGKVWRLTQDRPSTGMLPDNFLEIEFEAAAGVPYVCYVYIGACCRQHWDLFIQCNEMIGRSRDGRPRRLEPGNRSYLGKPTLSTEAGVPEKHPDDEIEPKYWEWRRVQLPSFATPGTKRVRVLSDKQSVGIAGVVVTSGEAPSNEIDAIRKLFAGK